MRKKAVLFKIKYFYCAIALFTFSTAYSQEKKTENYNRSDSAHGTYLNNKFSISLGGFLASNNSGITLGSQQLGLGIIIDTEDALGLETSSFVFRTNANYRFGNRRRHSLVIDYFSINRKSNKVLLEDIEILDQIYIAGTEISSKFYTSIIRAKYDYAFLLDNRVSLGASFGFFIMPLSFSIDSAGYEGKATDIIAPLPVLGLRSDFSISKRLYLKQSAELLYLKFSNFTGSIVDINISLEHKTFKHFGFGLGINTNRLNISGQGEDYPFLKLFGDISMDYTGMFIYASYSL